MRIDSKVRELIYNIVTGRGAQQENLSLEKHEWEQLCLEQSGDREDFPCSMHLDDWLELVEIAKSYDAEKQ